MLSSDSTRHAKTMKDMSWHHSQLKFIPDTVPKGKGCKSRQSGLCDSAKSTTQSHLNTAIILSAHFSESLDPNPISPHRLDGDAQTALRVSPLQQPHDLSHVPSQECLVPQMPRFDQWWQYSHALLIFCGEGTQCMLVNRIYQLQPLRRCQFLLLRR